MCCGGVNGCELQRERLSGCGFGEVCDVVVGVKREGCKRRAEATYRMRGLLQWRHENGATEGCTEKKQ